MGLTGKCKIEFEKWLEVKALYVLLGIANQSFYDFPTAMTYGVYQDFFDSAGIGVFISERFMKPYKFGYSIQANGITMYGSGIPNKFETRPEARAKGIQRANEIYNQNENE